MKQIIFIVFILALQLSGIAQNKEIDSLWKAYNREVVDSNKAKQFYLLSSLYVGYKPDSALILSWQSLLLSKRIKFEKGESFAMNQMANAYNKMGNYPRALEYYIYQLKIEEKKWNPNLIANIYMSMATVYQAQKDLNNALYYFLKSDSLIDNNIKETEDLKVYSLINL
ncbi:MAG: tetratricopeptide repeat protein, partial [Bacteroidota bacterium]